MLRRLFLVSSWLFFGVAVALAGPCDSIITHGLRNISVGFSEQALIANKYAKTCSYDYSSLSDTQMAELEVEVFGYGGGGGGYSRTRIEQAVKSWCDENRSIAQENRKDIQQTQVFYQGAVDAWQACIALNAREILISPRISGDARTVDIAIQFRGLASPDAVLNGVRANGFQCSVTTRNGEDAKFPVQLGNGSVNVNCERAEAQTREVKGQTYEYLARGTISVQTASDPFQLFFVEEYVPLAPDTLVAELTNKLARNELPVGTVIASVMPVSQFLNSRGPYEIGKWVLADGAKLPTGSLYGKDAATEFAPDLRYLQSSHVLTGLVSQSLPHGGQTASLISPELAADTWTWFAGIRDISGNRANNDFEQDADNFQVSIDNGAVSAQGRTFNWKHGVWGAWNAGSANMLGIATRQNSLFYYVKIN